MNFQNEPSKILEVGFGFWGSKVFLTAVKLKVFTISAEGSKTGDEVIHLAGLSSAAIAYK